MLRCLAIILIGIGIGRALLLQLNYLAVIGRPFSRQDVFLSLMAIVLGVLLWNAPNAVRTPHEVGRNS